MTAAKVDKRYVRKTYSLTAQHIERLDQLALRDGVSASDRIRRLVDREWERLKMDAWLDQQEKEKERPAG